MTRKPKTTKVKFTEADVQLLRDMETRWAQAATNRALAFNTPADILAKELESIKNGHFPRIAKAIEAEVSGQPLNTTDPRGGFCPGDGGLPRAMVPMARDKAEAAALRDLGKRLTAHIPKKQVFKNADGGSVTLTARTLRFRRGKRDA